MQNISRETYSCLIWDRTLDPNPDPVAPARLRPATGPHCNELNKRKRGPAAMYRSEFDLLPEEHVATRPSKRTLRTVRQLLGDNNFLPDVGGDDSTKPKRAALKPCDDLWEWQRRGFGLGHTDDRTPQQIAAQAKLRQERETRARFIHHLKTSASKKAANRIPLRPPVDSAVAACMCRHAAPPQCDRFQEHERKQAELLRQLLIADLAADRTASSADAAAAVASSVLNTSRTIPIPHVPERPQLKSSRGGRPMSSQVRHKIVELAEKYLKESPPPSATQSAR